MVCRKWSGPALCGYCTSRLEEAEPRTIDGDRLVAAFEHRGPARVLVHRLKYEGIRSAATVFGLPLVQMIDFPVDAVTYVPRVATRRWRYGIDQSKELARAIGSELGVPVVRLLDPGWWSPVSAGAPKAERRTPRFVITPRQLMHDGASWLLVDDVLTTGATMRSAAQKIREKFPGDVRSAVATSASEVTSLRARR